MRFRFQGWYREPEQKQEEKWGKDKTNALAQALEALFSSSHLLYRKS
jgi:hypothetical protein